MSKMVHLNLKESLTINPLKGLNLNFIQFKRMLILNTKSRINIPFSIILLKLTQGYRRKATLIGRLKINCATPNRLANQI